MSQPSPYTPGVTARSVPGRQAQIGFYDERASLIADLGEFVGRIRVEVAPRGVGKTSLLRQAQQRMEKKQIATVWVTAGEDVTLTAAIYEELRKLTKSWKTSAKRILVDSLESVTVSVGTSNIARVDAKWAKRDDAVHGGSREFEAVIRAAVDAAHEQGKTGLVIFVDEVQSSDKESLRTISIAWQHLQSEGKDVAVGLFTAGLPNSSDEITRNVTFSERFEFKHLHLLDDAAVKLALAVPAKNLGVAWDLQALDYAVDQGEGYPHKVQLIGEASWVAAGRPDPGVTIELRHVQDGVTDADEQMGNLYRTRWRNSTVQERELMLAMAELPGAVVLRADIAESMGVKSGELSMVRARLIEKGFIEPRDRGKLAFTVPGFGPWLRTNAED